MFRDYYSATAVRAYRTKNKKKNKKLRVIFEHSRRASHTPIGYYCDADAAASVAYLALSDQGATVAFRFQ